MVPKNLSICLSVTPIISVLAKQNGLKMAARAVFVSLFFLQKQLMYDFLAGNNCPDSPHSQGVMKFATQISPLLNYILW